MTPEFRVETTSHFDRTIKKLAAKHPDLATQLAQAAAILRVDPFNRSRHHPVKKLENVAAGEGQYRIRIGRWRFRYDITGRVVYLKACSLRREDTYR